MIISKIWDKKINTIYKYFKSIDKLNLEKISSLISPKIKIDFSDIHGEKGIFSSEDWIKIISKFASLSKTYHEILSIKKNNDDSFLVDAIFSLTTNKKEVIIETNYLFKLNNELITYIKMNDSKVSGEINVLKELKIDLKNQVFKREVKK